VKEYKFEAVIKASEIGSGGAYVEFPLDAEKEFGVKGRVPVVCFFEGAEYRGSLVKMGGECHIIGLKKEIREKLGKDIGDKIRVSLTKDLAERTVEVHPLLSKEFKKNPSLKKAYEKLSYTKQKEIYVQLDGAKKKETLEGRLKKILRELEA